MDFFNIRNSHYFVSNIRKYRFWSTMACHIICFVSFRFVSFRFVSFRFDLFRFVSICFVSFRFDLFRFVSICFVSFRFVSVSFRTLQGPHSQSHWKKIANITFFDVKALITVVVVFHIFPYKNLIYFPFRKREVHICLIARHKLSLVDHVILFFFKKRVSFSVALSLLL